MTNTPELLVIAPPYNRQGLNDFLSSKKRDRDFYNFYIRKQLDFCTAVTNTLTAYLNY
jgi:hypothetical protein